MKKCLTVLLAFIIMFGFVSIKSYASNEINSVISSVDENTKEYLNELGVNSEDGEGLSEISLKKVFDFLISVLTDKSKNISKYIVTVISIIVLNAIISTFTEDNNSAKSLINYVSVLCIVTSIIIPLKETVICAAAVIKTAAIFTDIYVPVLAAVIAGSGNVKLALTYNSFTLCFSAFIAELADKFFVPIMNMLFAFNILTSFTFESYKHKIFSSIRKLMIIILSLVSTVYTGLLTTQSILAVSSDNLTVRGIRFLSGTFIPIVGAGVSESISSVISSFVLMKNTIGVLIIVLIMLIFIPVIFELLIWYFALQICSITADMFGNSEISNMIDEVSSIISLINVVLVFITFVFVISTGVIIVTGK